MQRVTEGQRGKPGRENGTPHEFRPQGHSPAPEPLRLPLSLPLRPLLLLQLPVAPQEWGTAGPQVGA